MKRIGHSLLIFVPLLLLSQGACKNVLVRAQDYPMKPVEERFNTIPAQAYEAAKQALTLSGYKIAREDPKAGSLVTHWASTKSTSHYVDLFDHRDYGTVGAYYQVQVEITADPNEKGWSEVKVSAPARSVVRRIRTSHFEEKKILRKIADLLRREDFELTNVGADE